MIHCCVFSKVFRHDYYIDERLLKQTLATSSTRAHRSVVGQIVEVHLNKAFN
jgi:hypothetical protein